MQKNNRLIVVDDEPGILDGYRNILTPAAPTPMLLSSRSRGAAIAAAPAAVPALYEVSYCSSGEEALKKVEENLKAGTPFVGGFFDVKLGPGIDGIETIRQAQKKDPRLLVCIVSAYQDRNLEEIARIFGEEFDGQWDFMMKPFANAEIVQKAKNLVANWAWRNLRK